MTEEFSPQVETGLPHLDTRRMSGELREKESGLAFFGHSTFALKIGEVFLFDPTSFTQPTQNLLVEEAREEKPGSKPGISEEESKQYLSPEQVKSLANDFQLNAILNTHGHFDHFDIEMVRTIIENAQIKPLVVVPLGLMVDSSGKNLEKGFDLDRVFGERIGGGQDTRKYIDLFHALTPHIAGNEAPILKNAGQLQIGDTKITALPMRHSSQDYDLAYLLQPSNPEKPSVLVTGDSALNDELVYTLNAAKNETGKRSLKLVAELGGVGSFHTEIIPPQSANRLRELIEESTAHSAWKILAMMALFPEEEFPNTKIDLTHYHGPESLFGGKPVDTKMIQERFEIPGWMVEVFKSRAGKNWKEKSLLNKKDWFGLSQYKSAPQKDQETYATIVDLLERFFDQGKVYDQEPTIGPKGKPNLVYFLKPEVKDELARRTRVLQRGEVVPLNN